MSHVPEQPPGHTAPQTPPRSASGQIPTVIFWLGAAWVGAGVLGLLYANAKKPTPENIVLGHDVLSKDTYDLIHFSAIASIVGGVVGIIVGLALLNGWLTSAPSQPAPEPPAVPFVPAQWAPDPYGQAVQRWWDGTRWTEHTHGVKAPGVQENSADAST